MYTISIHDKSISVINSKKAQPITLSLTTLRLVYLFMPSQFKWRGVLPSMTEFRYINLDALSEQDFTALHTQILSQPAIIRNDFVFILKDQAGQSVSITLKACFQSDVDLMQALYNTREERQTRQRAWLQGDPQVSFNNITFDLHQMQQGAKKTIPWDTLDKIEITQTRTIGTTNHFRFIPIRGQGLKAISQGVSPKNTQEFIAELDFWRQRGTTPEAKAAAQQRHAEEKQKAKKSFGKFLMIVGGIIALFIILMVIVLLIV